MGLGRSPTGGGYTHPSQGAVIETFRASLVDKAYIAARLSNWHVVMACRDDETRPETLSVTFAAGL